MSRCSIVVSLGLSDRRYLVRAVENGCARRIDAQPEYEIACRRGQPVGFMTCRSGVLNVDVDGAARLTVVCCALSPTMAQYLRNPLCRRYAGFSSGVPSSSSEYFTSVICRPKLSSIQRAAILLGGSDSGHWSDCYPPHRGVPVHRATNRTPQDLCRPGRHRHRERAAVRGGADAHP